MQYLDIDSWNRKEHYHLFKDFEDPFFGLVADVEISQTATYCKEKGYSLFLFYHYACSLAVNQIETFRYRIVEDKVAIYDTIHVGTTVMRPDHTFSFSFIPDTDTFEEFQWAGKAEVDRIMKISGIGINENTSRTDAIYYSTVPWVTFTGLKHAKTFAFKDSVPRISFGKIYTEHDKKMMPTSIHAHHALMDGYHVGLLFDSFQTLLNHPEEIDS